MIRKELYGQQKFYNLVFKKKCGPYKKGDFLFERASLDDINRVYGRDILKQRGHAGHIDNGVAGMIYFKFNDGILESLAIEEITEVTTIKIKRIKESDLPDTYYTKNENRNNNN